MELFCAIDILDNKVVRLAQGDYNAVTVYNDDPVAQARAFANSGARWLHIVDLDGARSGVPTQLAVISEIAQATGLRLEVGGGVRCLLHISRLLEAGASRVVLGTGMVRDPYFAYEAIKRYGERICAGIDARDGEAAVEGWRQGSGYSAEEVIRHLKARGLHHLVYTDISRDGMQTGVDTEAYRQIAGYAGFPVTASGGVSTLSDIRKLAELGEEIVEAVIVGRALYEGSFTTEQALEALDTTT